MSEVVSYNDGRQALAGTVFRPPDTPRAAVLVLPTIMNPTSSVLDKARSLAASGYLAMVADFYGETPADFDAARKLATDVRETTGIYRARLRSGLKTLATLDGAGGLPLAAIGFCMGGQAALELARMGAPLFAAVSFHGLLDTDLPAAAGAIQARILVCHGDADPMVPHSQVVHFWEEMNDSKANWHFHSYAGVRHGFTNPEPNDHPAIAYNASADRQSWAAMYSLFNEILDGA